MCRRRRGRASRPLGLAVCLLPLLAMPVAAQEKIPVAIELVLALDASASVDREEFALQLEGLALAFGDPQVWRAIDNLRPFGAAVAVVQWGAPGETRVVVPFTRLENARDAKAFGFVIGLIRRWMRASSTSIAAALDDSRLLLEANGFDGQRSVIDISGDGPDNSGADIESARQRAGAAGITVNGLPIDAEDPTLETYYRDRVITGAGSFTEPASSFKDFARAIREKLLRELRPLES